MGWVFMVLAFNGRVMGVHTQRSRHLSVGVGSKSVGVQYKMMLMK